MKRQGTAQGLVLLAVLLAGQGTVAKASAAPPAAPAASAPIAVAPGAAGLAAADEALALARRADMQGDTTTVLEAATAALQAYRAACPTGSGCAQRPLAEAHLLLARHQQRRGLHSMGLEHAQAAAGLASESGDTATQVLALSLAADLAGEQGDAANEQRLQAQAQRLGRLHGGLELRARLALLETRILRRRNDNEGAARVAEAGLALAQQAGVPRLVTAYYINLSDALVAAGRPRAALQAAEQGMVLARRNGDVRSEQSLKHNAALARIGLRQLPQAREVLESLLVTYRQSGASADAIVALREFGDAFAAAGDLPAALALYHRERELAAQLMADDRDAALAELRLRHDQQAQQRRLDELQSESRLMSAQIDNRAAMQKVWAAGAAALLLAVALLTLMLKRVRELNRSLETNQAFLRAQSHRDPLTGLSNRRGLHDTAAARGLHARFEGALLLIDIDHFKRVNDGHGHAAGDVVLVEVARRLGEVVRGDDLVVRWGGEEFLIFLPGVDAAHAKALAQRVLDAIGAEPVALPPAEGTGQAGALRVTASLGYGCFPLPPTRLALSLERAINLADMALYTAKNQGRNCAVGIHEALAGDVEALRTLEADFDQARHEGRVVLERHTGPQAAPLTELGGVAHPA